MDKVIEIKKLNGCATLLLESGETLRIPVSILRERPARKGEVIEPLAYQELIARRGYAHALDGAVKLLALCDRTEGEIRERLSRAGYPDCCIDRVIEKLYAEELLDDAAFAQNWARSRAHRHGRSRIQRELTRRGIDRDTAREAVSALSDEEQLADAVRLTGKYLARTHGDMDRKLYQRTLAMLARHGYDAEIARRALETIANGQDEDNWEEADVKELFAWKPEKQTAGDCHDE